MAGDVAGNLGGATSGTGFKQAGYNAHTICFGKKAAILIIDIQRAFTDPAYPMGRSDHVSRAVDNIARLVDFARPLGVLVASCSVGWCSEGDMAHWKVSSVYKDMFYGDRGLEVDPRIKGKSDFHFIKGAPSIFFGTPLITFLTRQQVDTVIVTGCTTSGCVRASIVDAFSHGFRVIVPEPCCGDQEEEAHRANLSDVGRRYADVLTLEETMKGLQSMSEGVPCAKD